MPPTEALDASLRSRQPGFLCNVVVNAMQFLLAFLPLDVRLHILSLKTEDLPIDQEGS